MVFLDRVKLTHARPDVDLPVREEGSVCAEAGSLSSAAKKER